MNWELVAGSDSEGSDLTPVRFDASLLPPQGAGPPCMNSGSPSGNCDCFHHLSDCWANCQNVPRQLAAGNLGRSFAVTFHCICVRKQIGQQ